MTTTERITLAQRPSGLPDDSTWASETVDLPAPGDGEFLVKVDHISLDPAMRGWLNDVRSYLPPVQIGEVMRAAATGTVVESNHPDFAVGDAVTGNFGVTQYAVTDGEGVQKIDTSVAGPATWLGALGMPGLTAYHGLHEVGEMKAGDTVVISAAAGAVGSVAGQLAKAKGCTVIGIAGGPEKCAWLKEIGFDEVIDYKNENVLKRLRAVAPKGIDVYFDNVGGDILDAALANLRRGARVIICGAISTYNDEQLAPGPKRYMSLLVFRAKMQGFLVFDYPEKDAAAIADMSELISSGQLVARETVVEGGVEEFGRTLLGLFEGRNTGKLVLKIA
ncbi:zinc-binding dehydrogenase [Aeromicrobium sp. 636]|uniref:NADP-dependent oxidoreductase n=1 Tax=Aeromicrobium senzhongii TaxID=2663859 RepID=A0A8I0K0W1_9ACTN|nr:MULTISPECIES: NADP-dependent oxidoreductase [Aeromicrobium]MBC9226806.1 NADP-dependent oxidoreductase [Aeromicrobium senzhongii]MCQ3998906.1 zinc-binding dehydrogenase [Aeromicrobium sp. 636]MTB89611.1 zinc-binding dehydrogenase [Aeromicrobium senzhongii]QNL94263.1 NADP-dependent oxidoreductase [Aeromicrobium senzhongii]